MAEDSEIQANLQEAPPEQEWKFSAAGEYRPVEKDRVAELSTNADVIIINDNHPSSFIHTDWIEMIRELQQNGQQPSLLFEMIQDNYQNGLTDFVEGRISEGQFKTQVYDRCWDWDYRRYSPYFGLAKKLKIPAIAADLNLEEKRRYSNENQPVETYAGTRYVSPKTNKRDLEMTGKMEAEISNGRKPVLLVGGAHLANQVTILANKYGIPPEKILFLDEYVDGQHDDGFREFRPKEGQPVKICRLRPPERDANHSKTHGLEAKSSYASYIRPSLITS